jgi:hypothetical protein
LALLLERAPFAPRLMATAGNRANAIMFDKRAHVISDFIISDFSRAPASSHAAAMHDLAGHHRYCGGSACNGGERIVERRCGPRPRPLNACCF